MKSAELQRLRDIHYKTWRSTADEVWGYAALCAEDRNPWPCDVSVLLALLDDFAHEMGDEDAVAAVRRLYDVE